MRLFRYKPLNQAGFHVHLLMPVLAIVAVAGVGAYLLHVSNADPLPTNQTCRGYQFSTTGTTNPANSTISTSGCVQIIQKVLNGTLQASLDTSHNPAKTFGSYAVAVSKYAKADGVAAGYLTVNGKLDKTTASRIKAFQASFQYYNQTQKKYVDLTPSSTGTVGPATWAALCGLAFRFPQADKNYNVHTYVKLANNQTQKTVSGCPAPKGAPASFNAVAAHSHIPSNVANPTTKTTTPAPAGGGRGAGGTGAGSGGSTTSSGIPTVQLTAPGSAVRGASVTVSWTSAHATGCRLTSSGGNTQWNSSAVGTSGTVTTSALQATAYFVLTCNGTGAYSGYNATDTATTTVLSKVN